MASSEDTCVNCGSEFKSRSGGYRRQSLTSKLRGTDLTPLDVLSESFECDLAVTPNKHRFLCHACASVTAKVEVGRQKSISAKQEFKSASKEGYLKRKLDFTSPTTTPRRPSKRCNVLSTPVKKTTFVMHSPQVNMLHHFIFLYFSDCAFACYYLGSPCYKFRLMHDYKYILYVYVYVCTYIHTYSVNMPERVRIGPESSPC